MADEKERKSSDEPEKKIPVFTVLKNNTILKNIFVLDKPPLISGPKSIEHIENENQSVQEIEEILLVGRHPDCNITLEHPSISRFHLRILSKPSSLKLSVIDLSSVHGTWISGKKIEPEVRMELNEGDTMRLGASSRVYRLHWVPLSRAYDLENPFVPPSDALVPVEEIEETHQDDNCLFAENDQIQSLGNDLVLCSLFSDENSELSLKKAIPSAPPLPEYVNSSFFDEQEVGKKSPSREESEKSRTSDLWSVQLGSESVIDAENEQMEEEKNCNPQTHVVSEVLSEGKMLESPTRSLERESILGENSKLSYSDEELENQWSAKETHEQSGDSSLNYQPLATESLNACIPRGIDISATEDQQFNKENRTSQSTLATGFYGSENTQFSPVRSEQKSNSPVSFDSPSSNEQKGYPVGETLEQSEIPRLMSGAHAAESLNSSLPGGDVLLEIENQQFHGGKWTTQAPSSTKTSQRDDPESSPIRSEKKSSLPSIWSRRGKPASVLHLQTSRSRGVDTDAKVEPRKDLFSDLDGDEEETFTPDKELILSRGVDTDAKVEPPKDLFSDLDGDEEETFTPDKELILSRGVDTDAKVESLNDENIENKFISKGLFSDLDGDEEETFTPDKENFTPNTLLLKSMKKMGRAEEIKHSKSNRSSSFTKIVNPNIQPEEETLSFSEKENQTPKILQERKSVRPVSRNRAKLEPQMVVKSRTERLPFQPLVGNSTGKSKLEASVLGATTRSSKSLNYAQIEEKNNTTKVEKRKWNIIVDTTCLLNKESRKALQLLQGLKGTQLIIPRIVIRELDCMKRRGSLFRRTTEISSVLEWIEECMVNTKWWIHVQSSVEEGRPVAPTPPASPLYRFSEGSVGFPDGAPSTMPFSAYGSLLEIVTPTAEDHILECALLFRRTKNDGQLVLLSNDVTLKIKAMAEGLLCETAEDFRESLVNPFSDRFLWADSSPRGPTWSCTDDVILRERYSHWPSKNPLRPGDGAKGLKLILLHNSHYRKFSSIN
ncbi:FHA domain-containing protein PS1 [Cornus florida]|uniref:FHA domain-containing protein PS1 n=1 Tax=Cornus florida TaxID=4283 RepID=UPI0028A2C279|nr:FHA domain-containing protein PS1 [Cornus florida]